MGAGGGEDDVVEGDEGGQWSIGGREVGGREEDRCVMGGL